MIANPSKILRLDVFFMLYNIDTYNLDRDRNKLGKYTCQVLTDMGVKEASVDLQRPGSNETELCHLGNVIVILIGQ